MVRLESGFSFPDGATQPVAGVQTKWTRPLSRHTKTNGRTAACLTTDYYGFRSRTDWQMVNCSRACYGAAGRNCDTPWSYWPLQTARRFGIWLKKLADLFAYRKLHTDINRSYDYPVAHQISSALKRIGLPCPRGLNRGLWRHTLKLKPSNSGSVGAGRSRNMADWNFSPRMSVSY